WRYRPAPRVVWRPVGTPLPCRAARMLARVEVGSAASLLPEKLPGVRILPQGRRPTVRAAALVGRVRARVADTDPHRPPMWLPVRSRLRWIVSRHWWRRLARPRGGQSRSRPRDRLALQGSAGAPRRRTPRPGPADL